MTSVSFRNLEIEYRVRQGAVRALDNVSVEVQRGQVVALVGESGSGKTTLAMSVGRLLHRSANILTGEILVEDQAIQEMDDAGLRRLRADKLGYIFQDPVASLDPTMKIGRQVTHILKDCGTEGDAASALAAMRFQDVGQVLQSYPHEISGGMAQRVSIAMTLARNPSVIIADEPTAALDASIRTEIMELMTAQCRSRDIALIVATHDLGMVRRYADVAAVMYSGRVVEAGPTATLFESPRHPYTRALIGASLGHEAPGERLQPIPGLVRTTFGHQAFCAFADRCIHALPECEKQRPESSWYGEQMVCCLRSDELAISE